MKSHINRLHLEKTCTVVSVWEFIGRMVTGLSIVRVAVDYVLWKITSIQPILYIRGLFKYECKQLPLLTFLIDMLRNLKYETNKVAV